MTRRQTHKQILRQLGPDALRVYKALEALADSEGRLEYNPEAIARHLNEQAKETGDVTRSRH